MQFNQCNMAAGGSCKCGERQKGLGEIDVSSTRICKKKKIYVIRKHQRLNVFQVTAIGFVKEAICIQGRPQYESKGRPSQQ